MSPHTKQKLMAHPRKINANFCYDVGIKKEFEKFLKSPFGLEIWSGEKIVFRSKKTGVRGLLDFIKKKKRPNNATSPPMPQAQGFPFLERWMGSVLPIWIKCDQKAGWEAIPVAY